MALKFLNKKGWHTGSLRNIENVWKAEQKHEAEKRKLEELKKQIHEEREAQEFRLLQEQAGLIPKQERLEFLYDSGLSVGHSTVRNSTEEYLLGKPLEEKKGEDAVTKVAATPGSLFVEEKPYSANDAWRKLHTDPLLLIRQQEQAALARIRNNPVKMDLIKKSVEEKINNKKRKHKDKKEKKHKEKKRKKHHVEDFPQTSERKAPSADHKVTRPEDNLEAGNYLERRSSESEGSRSVKHSSPERKHNSSPTRRHERSRQRSDRSPERRRHSSPERRCSSFKRRCRSSDRGHSSSDRRYNSSERSRDSSARMYNSDNRYAAFERRHDRNNNRHDNPHSSDAERVSSDSEQQRKKTYKEKDGHTNEVEGSSKQKMQQPQRKLTDEERAARLKEMQQDAELHEEQRWHRLKKANDVDQLQEARRQSSNGKNFMDQTARSIYGADRGGSISVEESVRRRTHFIERSIGDSNTNTFQRL